VSSRSAIASPASRARRRPSCGAGWSASTSAGWRGPPRCARPAGAIPHALWNLLGLRAAALERRLDVVRPRLPAWLDWLEIHDLRVGDARAHVRFERRADGRVEVAADVRAGRLTVTPTETAPPAAAAVVAAA
jgi:hypothetical protein